MKHISDIREVRFKEGTAITIGKFDGVHLGHQRLIEEVLAQKAKGLTSVVIGMKEIYHSKPAILTLDEKLEMLEEMGVDYFIEMPMISELLSMEANTFLKDILLDRLAMKFLVVGDDFRFGSNRYGDQYFLREKTFLGYELKVFPKVFYEKAAISSTRIRTCITEGRMEDVTNMLGYEYFFSGEVIYGRQIGRTMNIPTANLGISTEKLLPPKGVYITTGMTKDKVFLGVSNLGTKPSIADDEPLGLETFFLNTSENLYGVPMKVNLLSYRREELYFSEMDALVERMNLDIEDAKDYFRERKMLS